jgi:predicted transcriptional regulator
MSLIANFLMFILMIFFSQTSLSDEVNLRNSIIGLNDSLTKKNIIETSKKARVFVFYSYLAGCPIVEKYVPDLLEIKKKYGNKVIIVNLASSVHAKDEIEKTIKHIEKTKNKFPLVIDDNSVLAKSLNITTSSTVVVVDLLNYRVKYKGRIDDRITLSYEKPKAQSLYLIDAIDSVLKNKKILVSETEAFGCEISVSNEK